MNMYICVCLDFNEFGESVVNNASLVTMLVIESAKILEFMYKTICKWNVNRYIYYRVCVCLCVAVRASVYVCARACIQVYTAVSAICVISSWNGSGSSIPGLIHEIMRTCNPGIINSLPLSLSLSLCVHFTLAYIYKLPYSSVVIYYRDNGISFDRFPRGSGWVRACGNRFALVKSV